MHRHRTNNAVVGWNSKRISIIGNQHPEVFFLLVQKLDQEAELVSWHMKPKVQYLDSQARNKEKCLRKARPEIGKNYGSNTIYQMICTNIAVRSAV